MKYFAGIGSRSTPLEIRPLIDELCKVLIEQGYVLRSGAAEGADTFFEDAYDRFGGTSEIYLPWPGFADGREESSTGSSINERSNSKKTFITEPTQEAFQMAAKYHPGWMYLTYGGKKLHARNCHQVLGYDLHTPAIFILCWKDPSKQGGTDQALRIAKDKNIPILNLFSGNKTSQVSFEKEGASLSLTSQDDLNEVIKEFKKYIKHFEEMAGG